MARRAASESIDAVLRDAVADVSGRAAAEIARAIADRAAARIGDALEAALAKRGTLARAAVATRRGGLRGDLTRWAADRRARRVPTFVIELTGLDTKRAIVARYGEGAVFEKGKPAPRAR
ncbi:hypothetical protein [Anaeromyxobacter oryzae]|uniref:Uncharacterized protein n=1 Tax=Anaeromyxobacter oryzae TaxID=2918170 RepID=A0ABM7X3M9_9BACT|nr:hypothetical protein [Anaeromyxobacter oryzae]BDG06411.1 hypothetical protein AMOR_54070 [Anaeromyxobacter oryzae]